jgi:DNA-binding MarR family transcriptional regulator
MHAAQLTEMQRDLLETLATHQLATAEQLAQITGRNVVSTRRQIRELEARGMLDTSAGVAGKRGRSAKTVALSVRGRRAIGCPKPREAPDKATHAVHSLMESEIAAAALAAARRWPELELRFLRSVRVNVDTSRLRQRGSLTIGDLIIPDATFVLMRRRDSKRLLFFVEADTGTESLVSGSPEASDIRSKVIRYQAAFASESYRSATPEYADAIRGFRVLIVTQSESREASLCRLLRALKPTDFVWVARLDAVVAEGFDGMIWAAGGQMDGGRRTLFRRSCAAHEE